MISKENYRQKCDLRNDSAFKYAIKCSSQVFLSKNGPVKNYDHLEQFTKLEDKNFFDLKNMEYWLDYLAEEIPNELYDDVTKYLREQAREVFVNCLVKETEYKLVPITFIKNSDAQWKSYRYECWDKGKNDTTEVQGELNKENWESLLHVINKNFGLSGIGPNHQIFLSHKEFHNNSNQFNMDWVRLTSQLLVVKDKKFNPIQENELGLKIGQIE